MLKEKILRRCMMCQAIELGNEIIPSKDCDSEFFKKLGYGFTDTYLSRECVRGFYSSNELELMGRKLLNDLEYESCN